MQCICRHSSLDHLQGTGKYIVCYCTAFSSKKGMHQCAYCHKFTNKHIDMVNACYDCVTSWYLNSRPIQQPSPYYATTTSWNPNAYTSPINPPGGINTKESNKLTLSREEVYTLFHKAVEKVIQYDWVLKAKDTLTPMIDMTILAILNEIFEELGYETIDTKFFKEI